MVTRNCSNCLGATAPPSNTSVPAASLITLPPARSGGVGGRGRTVAVQPGAGATSTYATGGFCGKTSSSRVDFVSARSLASRKAKVCVPPPSTRSGTMDTWAAAGADSASMPSTVVSNADRVRDKAFRPCDMGSPERRGPGTGVGPPRPPAIVRGSAGGLADGVELPAVQLRPPAPLVLLGPSVVDQRNGQY